MKELLELYNDGELNETQSLWLQNPKPAEELYDLNSDPHEINNIINESAFNLIPKSKKFSLHKINPKKLTNDLIYQKLLVF